MDEATRVSFGKCLASAVLAACLLIKSDIIVLLETARPVKKLRRRAALVSTEILQVPVPTFPQQAHVVIYALTELTPAEEGRQ